MRDSPWVVALGVAAFVLCWVPLFVASNARPSSRYAMYLALAGFLIGFLGMLLIAVGSSADPVYSE
jgi:hypothetical protein